MTVELAVVLPTLNERESIASVIARIAAALSGIAWEIVVVDDDSADGTAELARGLARDDQRIRVMQRFGRRGLAGAAIEGICATAAPYVAVMDADHQHDPALLPAMLSQVRSGDADIAIASRFIEGGSADGLANARRKRGSILANALVRRLVATDVADPMSGFFLIETARVRSLAPRLSGIGFKLLLDLLATAAPPLRVAEIPLRFEDRVAGHSKLDRAIIFEFLVGLYDKTLGRFIPTRFALFGTVGALGVAVHLLVLATLYPRVSATFWKTQAVATLVAMSFNFWLNNWLTYRDRRLTGTIALVRGWAGFCAACAIGALGNVATAGFLKERGLYWVFAALAGIVIGAVWNYALSNRFVWGRFG